MKNAAEWLVNNWSIIIAVIAIIVVIVVAVYKFFQLPTNKQVEKIKKCLLAWVIEAEKELGGGTGKAKLSNVYGIFVTSFPVLKNFISFEMFSHWVDDALVEMRKMLEENPQLRNIVDSSTSVENTQSENSPGVTK